MRYFGRNLPATANLTHIRFQSPAAIYVMLYSVHYFVVKTKMTGFFQTAFYFGYTAMFCLGKRLLDQAAAARVG